MSSFESAICLTPLAADPPSAAYGWTVPDGWQQGRGAFGGLPIGAMVGAVELTDRERTIRAVSIQLAGPALVGAHTVHVTPLRIGTRMSTWSVVIVDAKGAAVASGSVITGIPRSDDQASGAVAMPAAPESAAVPIVETPPPFPTFTQHLTFAPAAGFPMSGQLPETMGWIGFRDPVTPTAASLLALVDGWYTATIVPMRELQPIATVNFAATLLIDPRELTAGEPLLHHGMVTAYRQGFASEQRRLWTRDGKLAVDNLQTMAVG